MPGYSPTERIAEHPSAMKEKEIYPQYIYFKNILLEFKVSFHTDWDISLTQFGQLYATGITAC